MIGQILFLVSYQCPRCGTDLEAGPRSVETWLRCPRCGRASLPPTHHETILSRSPTVAQVDPETFYIGPLFDEPTVPSTVATAPPVVSGLSGQRVALMVMLMMAMGAIADGVISRSPASGFLGFLMLGAGLIWMIAGGVRL